MTTLLRTLLCGLVVLAPWLCGAVTARPQFYLAAALIPIALLRFVQSLFKPDGPRSAGIPLLLIVPFGFALIGIWQLSPQGTQNPLHAIESAPQSDLVAGLIQTPELTGFGTGLKTLSPEATQLFLAQIGLATLAFWLSFELFEEAKGRRQLLLFLAINGLAMTGFGIAQQLTWNGKLFWTIPLRYGGSPFGPFVNRNNGAGYLLLAFACAVGSLIVAMFPFGLGRRAPRTGTWRTQLSGWFLRLIGYLTPGVLLSFLAVTVIAVGIMASLSRAGVIGLISAVFILLPVMNRWKTSMLVMVFVLIGITYAGLIWMGQDERISKRLESLGNLSTAIQGRVDHWKEVIPLLKDFPATGSGWGTYRLVNPLYLSKSQDTWFQHAENQYVEVAAEAGIVGLAVLIVGLLLMAYASARAIRSDQEGQQLSTGVTGLLSVVAMGTISLSDFSLSIGSIVFTFAVLAGSVIAPFSKIRPVSRWILLAQERPELRLLVSVGLLLSSGLAFLQIHKVADVESVVDQIPFESTLPTLELTDCDSLISQLNTLSKRYPEFSEIYAATGELRIYRYRKMLYDSLQNAPESKSLGSRKLWASTHLERIDAIVSNLRSIEDPVSERELLNRGEVRENLPAALLAMNRCRELNPLEHRTAMPRAWLTHVLSPESTPNARNLALFVGSSDADVLFQAGQLSERNGEVDLNTRCWKRCLEVSDKWSADIWEEATLTRDENETLALFPNRLGPLLAIVERPRTVSVRNEILTRCQAIASADRHVPHLSIAKLSVELKDYPRAADAYLAAIRETPLDISLRLEASIILEKAGRLDAAEEVVGFALAMAPQRSDVKNRFELLIKRGRESSKSSQDRGISTVPPENR